MIYLYTQDHCPNCEKLKNTYKKEGVQYTERSAARLKNPEDVIDQEGLIIASMQNMELPVIVYTT